MSPWLGFTVMDWVTPVLCSLAVTERMPSASTWKRTSTRAMPAGMGGMPESRNRARLRQSSTASRSPWSTCTSRPVCPSLNVVKTWAAAVGMVELRGMSFSTMPPIVSSPSDRGMTSSSSTSSWRSVLVSRSACTAAPSATT